MSIYDPTFTSSQVARAAGMTASNFRAHLARGNWRIIGSSLPAESFGKAHLFTIYDVLGYALANQLVSLGIEPKKAFELAMYDFAHTGGGSHRANGEMRDPGGVYDISLGRTLFVYCPGAERGQTLPASAVQDAVELLMPPDGGLARAAIMIDINVLRRSVFEALGLKEGGAE